MKKYLSLKKFWLAVGLSLLLAVLGGCGDIEGGSEDTIYYRMYNQTNMDLKIKVGYTSEGFQEVLLPQDWVKNIFNHGETQGGHPLIKIYDNDNNLLLEKGLYEFTIHYTGDFTEIRKKDEKFTPGEDKHDCYIFLSENDDGDITDDSSIDTN